MQKCGLINEDKIMEAGKNKGLIFKNYMGHDNIAYPDDLEELSISVTLFPDVDLIS